MYSLWSCINQLWTFFTSLLVHQSTAQAPGRETLLNSLKGQRVVIPDLKRCLRHWPNEVNPHLLDLEKYIEHTLDRLFEPGKRKAKYRATKIALFVSSWWPKAHFAQLQVAAALSLWLFIWDDETDTEEYSSLVKDFTKCQEFRHDTIMFVRDCLSGKCGLSNTRPHHYIIGYFQTCGDPLAVAYNKDQLNNLVLEIEMFIKMTEVEQRLALSARLPSVEEYEWRRMGSSAVGVCLAISEYCLDMTLSAPIRADTDMCAIRTNTNIIVSVVNDILSAKKEIEQDQLDSLIPLLYTHHGDIQSAMTEALKRAEAAIVEFEIAADNLLARYSNDIEQSTNIRSFIEGCRYACTANLEWSLVSGRYSLPSSSLQGGLEVYFE